MPTDLTPEERAALYSRVESAPEQPTSPPEYSPEQYVKRYLFDRVEMLLSTLAKVEEELIALSDDLDKVRIAHGIDVREPETIEILLQNGVNLMPQYYYYIPEIAALETALRDVMEELENES